MVLCPCSQVSVISVNMNQTHFSAIQQPVVLANSSFEAVWGHPCRKKKLPPSARELVNVTQPISVHSYGWNKPGDSACCWWAFSFRGLAFTVLIIFAEHEARHPLDANDLWRLILWRRADSTVCFVRGYPPSFEFYVCVNCSNLNYFI